MVSRLLLVLVLLLSIVGAVAAQSEEQPEDPRILSFTVCDWGLLAVEQVTEQADSYLTIAEPADYSGVAGSSFTLSGTGAGLFEGNVIVEVTNDNGDVLFSGTTTLQGADPTAEGTWSLDVTTDVTEATPVFLRVYSESPDDGSTVAFASLRLNLNSEFGLSYVDITSPQYGAAIPNYLLTITGTAGALFENNLEVEVRDFATGTVLAETFATVETDELGGSGPFTAEISYESEFGAGIEVVVSQPPMNEGDAEVSDITFAVVDPLAQSYPRILNVRSDDPILGTEELCAVAGAEFDNENIQPLTINDVTVFQTMSMLPLVNLSVDAAGSSNCPAPLRSRIVNTDNAFDIVIYRDVTQPVPCTMDLVPLPQRLSLGTLSSPDFTITINGQPVE